MFRRNVGTALLLHATDGTGTERAANPSQNVSVEIRLVSQEPFVSIAAATGALADASDLP